MKNLVLIVDDHPTVCKGLEEAFRLNEDFEACCKGGSLAQARTRLEECKPNLMILDVFLSDGNGLDFIKEMKALKLLPPTLVFSMCEESLYAKRCIKAGAKGYIMKTEPLEKIIDASQRILRGEIVLSNEISHQMLANWDQEKKASGNIESLSDREIYIYKLMEQEKTMKQIAFDLSISIKTVETYRMRIMKKLDISNHDDLIRYLACHQAPPESSQT